MKFLSSLALLVLLPFPAAVTAASYTCVSFEYPPLITGGAEPTGFAVELVRQVFRQMGDDVAVNLYPWERAMAMVKAGQADCIFTIYRSPVREQFLDYSHEVLAQQVVYFFARKQDAPEFNGNMDLVKGVRIGVARQINYGPRFEGFRDRLVIDEASTIEQNFRKLAAGRVDLVPSNLHTAMATLALPGMRDAADTIVRLSPPIEAVPSYIGFSRQRHLSELRDRFDSELKKFFKSDAYRAMLEKYQW
ncbi:transporter substrate-binding domain-containing protein [Pseudoduganella ginsengisoli]|uniref:Transporter substrate-binding domain-containing protein n=1 Tax=Pseudoduganella ginsengisoli TaxID=1462440 RepID=A0A6L6Q6V7_9BURK|nr:transporter substrate-binding domain-containing protein [Pseudoduganella ginsengisoli]MTW04978.1 transporter substrate-binding domain-containing protein [Pseudoduganella ginsengisoli]